MEETKQEFFHITFDMLAGQKIFPFHIYVYNPVADEYTAFLWGNYPLQDELEKLLLFIIDRGGSLAVNMNQKRTFLRAMDLTEEDVPGLKAVEVSEAEQDYNDKKEKLEKKLKETPFHFNEEFAKAAKENNYLAMITRAREEVQLLPVTISHTVSLARYLSDVLMTEDSYTNRVVAVSYFLAKGCGMVDERSLGDVVVGAFLHHIGHTQLDLGLVRRSFYGLNEDEQKSYRKHGGLAQHLLKKCKVELSERVIKIILDHHERVNGKGYPNSKTGEHIDPLALIVGAVSHVFEYSEGRVHGTITPITNVLKNLKEQVFSPGLEFEFGDTILSSLANVFSNQNLEEESSKESGQEEVTTAA